MDIEHCLKYLKSLPDHHIKEILYSFYKSSPESIKDYSNLETVILKINDVKSSSISLYGEQLDMNVKLVSIGYNLNFLNTPIYYLRIKTQISEDNYHLKLTDINNLVSIIRKYKIEKL